MRFVCDVNVSRRVTRWLAKRSEGTEHVNDIFAHPQTPDSAIARYADDIGAIVVTHDSDYKISFDLSGRPKQTLYLKTKNIIDSSLSHLLEHNWTDFTQVFREHSPCLIEVFSLDDWVYYNKPYI